MNIIKLNSSLAKARQYASMLKGVSDPMKALQNTPELKAVMDMVRGKSPEEVFYAECEKLGVDPNLILGMLR